MTPIYFDITDIVTYAQHNARVSGIQRVQLRLIASLLKEHGYPHIRCTYFDETRKCMVEFDPTNVLAGVEEFDNQVFLAALGIYNAGSVFPPKLQIKQYLRRYDKNKALRALKKVEVYWVAFFTPEKLKSMGFSGFLPRKARPTPVEKTPLQHDPDMGALVFLGANWSFPSVIEFGRALKQSGGIVFQMIYDLIPNISPQYCDAGLVKDFNNWLNQVATYSTHFTCISEWTHRDLRAFLGSGYQKYEVKTVPLAHELAGFARNQTVDAPTHAAVEIAARPFALCVGTIEIRKNGIALLRVWQELLRRRGSATPRLVFAGKRGWLVDDFMEMLESDAQLRSVVTLLQAPTDTELAYLYRKCLFSLYPSRYEGWGLPVGESAWFGRYCIASGATSLPEVCGDLIDYVDPSSDESILAAVERALDDPDYLRDKEQKIQSTTLRTWDDVAKDLYDFVIHSDMTRHKPAHA